MEAGPHLAAFIHVPLLARDGTAARRRDGITLEQLVDAGEAMLMAMVKLTRQALRKSNIG
jgi:pyroglutamyl-peptidase